MALPKFNTTPYYDVTIPSTQMSVTYRPYLVKEEKVLMIAFESGDQKLVTRAIGNTLNSCISSDIDVFELTTFDIEFLFTKIRSKSVGEKSQVILTCESCDTANEISIDIDALQLDVVECETEIIEINEEIKVEMSYPKFGNILDVKTTGESIEDGINMVASSITAICTEDVRYGRDEITPDELMDFILELTTDQFSKLAEFLQKIPKLEKKVDYVCKSCGTDNSYTLRGMKDFLA